MPGSRPKKHDDISEIDHIMIIIAAVGPDRGRGGDGDGGGLLAQA